jgi:dTDP-4-amino-4,6-dideoxygalactose transaminase
VPSKDYAAQYRALMPELLPELERVLLEEDPILGDALAAFEQDFARYVGTAHAVGVGSGTDALHLSLRALGVGAGAEVITVTNTFVATITAIVMAGATPVLVEPCWDTMNVSAEAIAAAITPRTRAVIAVHLYGRSCPIAAIAELCRERGLLLLEDAAQAHGACGEDGRRVGAYGRAGCFSFHPSKNLGAFGDGGLVTTGDGELAARLRCLRNLGKVTKYDVAEAAPNAKLDTLQAALLRIKLRHLETWNARRAAIAARYASALQGMGDLELPPAAPKGQHVHHLYVVRTSQRDALRRSLMEAGINAGIHYPIPAHLQAVGRKLGFAPGEFPIAERLSRTVLSLPLSQELSDAQIDDVCATISKFFA